MTDSRHTDFMHEALRIAGENMDSNLGGPFGAVIVYRDQIIASGANQVTRNNDPTAHAEVVAIREACQALDRWSLQGCDIYTSCEPCPMCLAAIWWARLDRIWFAARQEDAAQAGFDDALFYHELAQAKHQRRIPMNRLLDREGGLVLQRWQQKEDRLGY